jgi:hypothetical protein
MNIVEGKKETASGFPEAVDYALLHIARSKK